MLVALKESKVFEKRKDDLDFTESFHITNIDALYVLHDKHTHMHLLTQM